MMNFLRFLWLIFFTKSTPIVVPPTPPAPVEREPDPVLVSEQEYKFDTPQNARHSIRVICDEEGLTWKEKNDLTATIQAESGFNNFATRKNYAKDGVTVWSTDWGICQINDYWHVEKEKSFPSAEYIVANPEKAVRWTARMFKAGKQKLWVAYSSGAYERYL